MQQVVQCALRRTHPNTCSAEWQEQQDGTAELLLCGQRTREMVLTWQGVPVSWHIPGR